MSLRYSYLEFKFWLKSRFYSLIDWLLRRRVVVPHTYNASILISQTLLDSVNIDVIGHSKSVLEERLYHYMADRGITPVTDPTVTIQRSKDGTLVLMSIKALERKDRKYVLQMASLLAQRKSGKIVIPR